MLVINFFLRIPMSRKLKTNIFYKLYLNIISSIALMPSIFLMLLFGLSILTLNIDHTDPDLIFPKATSIKNIISPDSARSLLSTISSGMITLMIFSFTMVMVVLNQTASNYSPRVLSTLIGKKFHQVILGIYLGTIAYAFMVIASIESEVYKFDIPILSVIITAFLGILCLVLFIIFIQSISSDIQIGNIINKIYRKTLKSMDFVKTKIRIPECQIPDMSDWEVLESPVSGYLDEVNDTLLIKKAYCMDISIKMIVTVGQFVNQKDPFFYVNRRLSESEQKDIFHAFVFRHQEIVEQNYLYGFKQLTEIAVKALSPGINDPGTAIQAIDRLTDLFVIRMEITGFLVLKDKEEKTRFIYQPIPLEDILYISFSSIKNYTGSHVPIMIKLLTLIKTLARNNQEENLTSILIASVKDAIEQFMPELKSKTDKDIFVRSVEEFSAQYPNHPTMKEAIKLLEPLKV